MLSLEEVQVTLVFYEKEHGEAETCYAKLCLLAAQTGPVPGVDNYEEGLSLGTNEGREYWWDFAGIKDEAIEFLKRIGELQS